VITTSQFYCLYIRLLSSGTRFPSPCTLACTSSCSVFSGAVWWCKCCTDESEVTREEMSRCFVQAFYITSKRLSTPKHFGSRDKSHSNLPFLCHESSRNLLQFIPSWIRIETSGGRDIFHTCSDKTLALLARCNYSGIALEYIVHIAIYFTEGHFVICYSRQSLYGKVKVKLSQ
jgi:hypothetical protein